MPPPRNGCDWHRLHPNARHGTHFPTCLKRRYCQRYTVVAVPVEELAVGLQRGRTDMFIIATRNGNKLYDDISCFADDQEKRNKWIAVLRRMGVPIFDLSSSDGHNTEGRPVVF